MRFSGILLRLFLATLLLPAVRVLPALRAQENVVPTSGSEAVPTANAEPVIVEPGTHIPLSLINSVSTKHSIPGDRVYLETVFPILVNGRITIPPGSYVMGTVTQLKRPGRVKGKGELFLRFDSLTLPNGVVREFRARLSSIDARGDEHLDHTEGAIKGDSNIGGDLRTVGEAAAAGGSIGVLAGSASKSYGLGGGIGAGAGAAAGLLGVLLTRGPEATLAQGSTVEMVLDRPLTFQPGELTFKTLSPTRIAEGAGPATKTKSNPRPRLPF